MTSFGNKSELERAATPAAGPRLDRLVVARGLAESRTRAQALIRAGRIAVDGRPERRVAARPGAAAIVTLSPGGCDWVSRGALKLRHALDYFGIDPGGRTVLDVGASTGGFTEMALAQGARRVYAVDVGHGQLHPRIAEDSRVVAMEGVDARTLDRVAIPEPVDLLLCDVSFIGLAKALARPLALAAPRAWLVALVKPQFELGPGRVGKGGVVRDPAHHAEALAGARAWLDAIPTWRVVGVTGSPIEGGSGNREFLMAARREPIG